MEQIWLPNRKCYGKIKLYFDQEEMLTMALYSKKEVLGCADTKIQTLSHKLLVSYSFKRAPLQSGYP